MALWCTIFMTNKPFIFILTLFISCSAFGQEDKVFDIYFRPSEFPGGINEFNKYIESNLIYPSDAKENRIQGIVIIEYTVDEEGRVVDSLLSVARGVTESIDNEAIRLFAESPDWIPAIKKEGEPPCISTGYFPIHFRLEEK